MARKLWRSSVYRLRQSDFAAHQQVDAIKKAEDPDPDKPWEGQEEEKIITTEMVLVAMKLLGLSIDDLGSMTVGLLMDFMLTEVEMREKQDEPKTRKATQDDFDAF